MTASTFYEILLTTIASIGGASVVVGGLGLFLSNVWAERIKQTTISRFEKELENLKAKNVKELEDFRVKAAASVKEREIFSNFSTTFYQKFFEQRIAVYSELLNLIDEYTGKMSENFLTEELENWHEHYVTIYDKFRRCVTKNQLYLSNKAEKSFNELRAEIGPYLAEADRAEAYAVGRSRGDPELIDDARRSHESDALSETIQLMKNFMAQIQNDVSMMRSRVEVDAMTTD